AHQKAEVHHAVGEQLPIGHDDLIQKVLVPVGRTADRRPLVDRGGDARLRQIVALVALPGGRQKRPTQVNAQQCERKQVTDIFNTFKIGNEHGSIFSLSERRVNATASSRRAWGNRPPEGKLRSAVGAPCKSGGRERSASEKS